MLKELKKWLKAEQEDKTIFDIVLYGSVVKGKSKPSDIDIIVIFIEGTLKERLAKLQIVKRKIKYKDVDVKSILWKELFEDVFFGKTGVFLEGISVFDSKPFSSKIGFSGWSLFSYNLRDKNHTEKVKFNYVLSGRDGKGMVEKLNGLHLAPGLVKIPIRNSLEFEEVMKMHNISNKKKNILLEI